MKGIKRTAAILFAGFLAFAPPGTLIFGAILLLSLIRNTRVVAVGAFILAALFVIWLLLRRRSPPNSKTSDPTTQDRAGRL